jgi:hypothetical protein
MSDSMPYKDPERKKEWERVHRPQRLARRRELRRLEVARQTARPEATSNDHSGYGLLVPLVAGGALSAYDPKLGIAAGSLTLLAAAIWKKDWRWWVVGSVILAVALFFHWEKQNAVGSWSDKTE